MSSIRYYDWIAHFGRRTPDKTAVVDLGQRADSLVAEVDRVVAGLEIGLRGRGLRQRVFAPDVLHDPRLQHRDDIGRGAAVAFRVAHVAHDAWAREHDGAPRPELLDR